MSEKKGVEFKGGSLHDGFCGFDGFGGSGFHLALLLLVLQIQNQEAAVTVLTVLAVSAVVAVSVVTAIPLKLKTPFLRHPDTGRLERLKQALWASSDVTWPAKFALRSCRAFFSLGDRLWLSNSNSITHMFVLGRSTLDIPTTTNSQKSKSTFSTPPISIAVHLPSSSQYTSHLHCTTLGTLLVFGVSGCSPSSLKDLSGRIRDSQAQPGLFKAASGIPRQADT